MNAAKTQRKTTDLAISPEDWLPVANWLEICQGLEPEPRMFINIDAEPGLRAIAAKFKGKPSTEDRQIRLPNASAAALAEQFRFWESCMDELSGAAQRTAPNSGYFQSLALAVEDALDQTQHSTTPPLLRCSNCGERIGPNESAVATVDLDRRGRATALAAHAVCNPA